MARKLEDLYKNDGYKARTINDLRNITANRAAAPTDNSTYYNMLNQLLQTDALSSLGKNGYTDGRELLAAAVKAGSALKVAQDNGIGDSSLRNYLRDMGSAAWEKGRFMNQFKNQQDYNENYAYPMSVKGKTDDEILTMLGAAGTAMGFEDQGAYDAWLNDYYRNHTQTGVGDKIGFNRSKASKLDEMISALEGKTYEPVKTQAWMDAQADVARYSDPTVPQHILDAQAAADATYADQQRLLDVYNRGVSGQQLTDEEQALFDSYTGSNDAWGRFVQEISSNDASMQDIMGKMNAMGKTTQQNHALINGGYAYYLTGNTRDVQALNAAKAAEQEAQAALDAYDDAHDARIAAMPEVQDTFDTSKLWADIDGADSDDRKALEDALKQAKRAVRQAESAAKTGYNEALLRAKIDVSRAEGEVAELVKQYMGLAATGKSLEKQKRSEARPEAPVKVDEVGAYHDERLKNLASAGEIVMNEQQKAEEEAARMAMADNELLNQYEGERDALDIEHMALVAQQEGVQARSKYNDLAQAPDFEAASAYDSSIEDELYRYINTKGTSRATETGYSAKTGDGVADWGAEGREMDYIQAGYSFLTAEEVLAYSYIYKTQGKAAAQLFLDSFKTVRAERMRTQEIEGAAKFAEDYGAWASVVSLGTNFKSGLMYPFQALDAAINPNHNKYSSLYSSNYVTNAIRDVRGQAWSNWLSDKDGNPTMFMGEDLGRSLYNTIMSLGDMGVALAAGKVGGVATGSKFAQGVTQLVMSSEAGSAALKANLERGLPTDKALGMSVASALIEALTEKYSIEALLANPKNAAQYLAKNIITEGSEEAASNLANTLVDLLVNADQAELMQAANEKGWAAALTEYAQSVGLDAIMGALSGGVMGGGSVAVNAANKTAGEVKTGKQINKNETYKQLHDLAVAMPEGSKARELAWKSGEKASALKAGRVYNALMQELDEKSRESVRSSMVSDIKRRLMELGATGDVTAYADAIQKLWMDEKLSTREQNLIASSKAAMQVQRELLDNGEWKKKTEEAAYQHRMTAVDKMVDVQRLASKGYVSGENKAASAAISDKASTTYANADRETAYNNTAYTNDGAQVTVQRIEEQDGKPVYIVEQDGQSVAYALNDLELDSYNTELLVQPLKQGKMSAAGVNAALQFYAGSKMRASTYVRGFQIAYNAGLNGYGMPYVNANSISGALPQEARIAAYAAGKAATKKAKPKLTRRSGKVILEDGINYDSLDNGRKAAVDALRPIAEALGIEIRFFASKADKSGSYAKWENGSYKNGVLRLDINAGKNSVTDKAKYAILRTASHELTHYIAEASPELYKELQEFAVTHLVEGGKSMEQLIDDKKARENREITDDEAIEEIVADACEMMLKDSTAIQTLANENATLFEKIANWLKDFFDKIREAFTGVEAVHSEAAALRVQGADGLLHYIDGLQELWDRALVDAGRNMQAAEEIGVVYDAATESAAPTMYSLRTWEESEYVADRQKAAEELAKALNVSKRKALRWIDDINGIAKMVADNKELLDYEANEFTSAIKSNAEYGGSVDFSTICAKRRLATGTLDAIQRALRNSVLTQDDIFRIRNMMLDKGYEVACGLCYVESARKDFGRYAKAFLDEYKQTNPDWIPDMADVNTVDGLDDMRREHPEAYAAYEKYMNKLAQRKPKLYEKRTEYRNEILKKFKGDDTVSKKNLAGGFRIQSFSDFEIVHLLDMMQVIMDMSHVGLAGQAYTKVPDFAWALGDTGLKINLSMIAKGVKDGKIVFDEREGMKVADAKALRDRYSKNVGTILVVFSDAQLKAALNDDFIDFIIPFHRSQWNKKNYGALGLPTDTRDFTSQQNERYIKPHYNERGKRIRPVNYSPNAYWDYAKTGKENAETYLRMCAEDGRRPKFAKLLVDNGDGSYSLQPDGSTDGYWKLLIDFKMYDNAGDGSPQLPVQPNFNMEQARRMLEEYKGGHAAYPVAQDIVDEFVKEYKGEKRSVRDGYADLPADAYYKDGRIYNYDFLVAQKPMKVVRLKRLGDVLTEGKIDRKNIRDKAMENALEQGEESESGAILVENVYTHRKVEINNVSIKHSLSGDKTRLFLNSQLSSSIGEIIKNSIPVNGLKNTSQVAVGTYAMAGYCVDENGYETIVISTIEQRSGRVKNVELYDVDHSVSGRNKKRSDSGKPHDVTEQTPIHLTASDTISIAELLENINRTFQSILSEDVLRHFGEVRNPAGYYAERVLFQARDADTISSREALANALETAAKNDLERGLLADYKKIIQSLNEDEAKLKEYGQIIKELSFKKGGLSTSEKDELAKAKNRAEIVRERLNRNDKKLLKLEATEALKAVVAREKVVAERKIREKKDAQLAAYRERTHDTLTRSALRDRIKHDVKILNRLLLNETDTKHIPEELKGAVAQFLTAFTQDSSVFDKSKLDDLRVAYDKISDRAQNNEEISEMAAAYDAGMADLMTDLRTIIDGRRLSELDAEETKMVRDIVQHLLHVVRNTNKLFFEARSEDIAANGQKLIEEADKHGPAKSANAPVVRHIRSLLREGMMTPSYFFKQLGGVGKKLFDALKEGESQYGLRVKDAQRFFDEQAKKYNYDAWRLSDPLKMTTKQGKQIVLTREQALGLYATWKRENSDNGQNAKHLSEGGFVYEEAMKKGKDGIEVDTKNPNKMTEADMQQVANWLTDEQKAFADELVRYMSQDMARLGNQVSMTLFGVEKFTEKAYCPYQTSQDYRYTPLGQAAATNDQRLKHSSFTRRTQQHANNPIIASDFTTVWANHVNHMILYSSMCVPLENVNRVFNYQYVDENNERQSVKATLKDAYGPQAIEYIKQLMTDINGGVQVKGDNISSKPVSLYKRNAVLGSLSVAIQQPSSVVRAMALVDPKYFTHGAAMGGNWNELTKHSGVAVIKEMGGFDTSTGYGAQDWLLGHRADTKLEAAKNKVEKASGILPETMDKLAWTAIWRAVKAEIRDTTSLEVGSEEFYQAAAKRFDEVISYTQVYDSVLAKSQMMRNRNLDMFTAFMSEPTLTYNMLLDAFTHRGKPDSVSIPRAMAAFVSTAAVNALLKALVTAARDDDEEKSYLEKYLGKSLDSFLSDLNPLNMLPYARDIVTIAQGWSVERPDMSVVSDFFTGIKRGKKAFEDGDIYQGIKEIAAPAGMVLGVPVKNVWRDAEAIVNLAVSIVTGNILPDNAGNVKYSLLDALPFYDGSPTGFYGRRLDAMLAGDEAELESLTIHLETGMGKDAKTIKSQTKTELGKRYKAGKIADTIATDILMDYFGMDADEAYWQLKEWREKEAHKDEEDYSFSRTDDLEEALLGGKTAQIEAAKKELAAGGYTDKEVTSKAKSAIKNLYMDGKITMDKALKLVQEQTGMTDKNELYWLEKEWAYTKANPDGEWSKYMDVHAAIESGKGAKQAAKELLAHGVEKGDAARVIATKWKETYVSLYKTDRKAALDLHSRILDMYVALGYSRSYQIKYIKDNWFD